MAIIGKSLNTGLYQRVTEEGSKYRELKYQDVSETKPLLPGYHKKLLSLPTEGVPGIKEEVEGTGIMSDIQREITTRIDDVARITKLLATRQGIKWEAHNVELEAIQNNLEQKHGKLAQEAGGTIWDTLLQIGKNLVGGLVGALDTASTTLAQVAVAGTGAHLSSWLQAKHAYLGKDAASEALYSGKVTFDLLQANGDIEPDISYHQLPTSDKGPVEEARKPKGLGGPVEPIQSASVAGKIFRWKDYNQYGSLDTGVLNGELVLPYETTLEEIDEGSQLYYKAQGSGNLEGGSEESSTLPQLRQPSMSKDGDFTNASRYGLAGQEQAALKTGDLSKPILDITNLEPYTPVEISSSLETRLLETGSLFRTGSVNTHREVASSPEHTTIADVSWNLENNYNESSSYQSQFSSSLGFFKGAQKYDSGSVSGPWKHDGAHALMAGTAGSKKETYQKDGGQTRNYLSTKNMPTGTTVNTRVDNGRIDMIPFWIRAISADGTVMDNAYLFFEANLDSYSDNYDASWESTQYIGRADKFWNYTGFDRQISFSFKMVAQTKSHLKPIYNRLNGLLSMVTPSYGNSSAFMQGVLAEVTIGDLLSNQLGFIKSVGLKWETDYPWEIGKETIIVPHVLDVSVGFTPIHQFVPQLRRRYFELVNDQKQEVDTFIVNHEKLYNRKY